jgi:hypothetical protein
MIRIKPNRNKTNDILTTEIRWELKKDIVFFLLFAAIQNAIIAFKNRIPPGRNSYHSPQF